MVVNFFEGGRRVLRVLQALTVLAVVAIGLSIGDQQKSEVQLQTALRHSHKVLVDGPCRESDWAQWETGRVTQRGTPVALKVCFQRAQRPLDSMVVRYADPPAGKGELSMAVLDPATTIGQEEIDRIVKMAELPVGLGALARGQRLRRSAATPSGASSPPPSPPARCRSWRQCLAGSPADSGLSDMPSLGPRQFPSGCGME